MAGAVSELGLGLVQRFFSALALTDIASDFGSADDLALVVLDRGNRQRYINQATVLASAHGFVVLNGLAAADAFENPRLFMSGTSAYTGSDAVAVKPEWGGARRKVPAPTKLLFERVPLVPLC